MQTFQSLLAKKAFRRPGAHFRLRRELTPQSFIPRFGDYQTNVALVIGKQRGEIACAGRENRSAFWTLAISLILQLSAGAGLSTSRCRKTDTRDSRDERLGIAETESPRRIVIDFGSPNVAKPMHVGHLLLANADGARR